MNPPAETSEAAIGGAACAAATAVGFRAATAIAAASDRPQ